MSYINWGNESPEQRAIRRRLEEQAIYEQAARIKMQSQGGVGASRGTGKTTPTVFYVRAQEAEPWEELTNVNELNAVFGEGGWQTRFFETIDVGEVFAQSTVYVFIDGSDIGAEVFLQFLDANHPAIQAWVQAGGNLFMNCAPNDLASGTYSLYLGDASLSYDDTFTDNAIIAEGASIHPIFVGPGDPGTSWMGDSFGHAFIVGMEANPPGEEPTYLIVRQEDGAAVCVELALGNGRVMLGGMTITYFHDPQPEATYLRQNIHSYLSGVSYTPQLGIKTISAEEEKRSSKRG